MMSVGIAFLPGLPILRDGIWNCLTLSIVFSGENWDWLKFGIWLVVLSFICKTHDGRSRDCGFTCMWKNERRKSGVCWKVLKSLKIEDTGKRVFHRVDDDFSWLIVMQARCTWRYISFRKFHVSWSVWCKLLGVECLSVLSKEEIWMHRCNMGIIRALCSPAICC